MKKMFFTILGVLIAAIGILVIAIATRPTDFTLRRSATMAARPATVFAQVNDFHRWTAWSPWEKLDPGLKREYSGPDSGVGAHYHWVGNPKVGEGKMTITESKPGELVRIKLEFIKPFSATNETTLTFKLDGNGTQVDWTMTGKNGFMSKAFDLFMNMDKTVGKDFEKGLADMKTVSEAAAKT